jgi:hypothetical protein
MTSKSHHHHCHIVNSIYLLVRIKTGRLQSELVSWTWLNDRHDSEACRVSAYMFHTGLGPYYVQSYHNHANKMGLDRKAMSKLKRSITMKAGWSNGRSTGTQQ